MRRIVVATLLLLLASCSRFEYPENRPILPKTQTIESFTPEIVITIPVGEVMVTLVDREVEVYLGFEAAEDFKLPNISSTPPPTILKGSRWICSRYILIDDRWDYWCSATSLLTTTMPGNPSVYFYDLAIDGRAGIIGVVKKTSGGLTRFDNVVYGKLLPVDTPGRQTEGSYKHELIYNGKSKDTIRISYREYINDMARPAFYQDLTYDLLESQEIAFRDLRIEVLEATNSAIKFIVKK
jgi:hypothetical protein